MSPRDKPTRQLEAKLQQHYQIYRELFTNTEISMLDASPPDSPLSELSLLRILLRRTFLAQPSNHSGRRPVGDRSNRKQDDALSLKRQLDMLSAFGTAGAIMASLVRYHHHVTADIYADPWLAEFAIKDLKDLSDL